MVPLRMKYKALNVVYTRTCHKQRPNAAVKRLDCLNFP